MIRWDEENRISTITDNGHTSYYVYDAGGERSLKRTAQGETFYVNAYFVIREGEVASKHFFAGSQRIATKMTKQESQTVHGKGNNEKPTNIIYEKEQYFYHPDHLGSSSFVTDEKGKVYEHLEYFPYGETFAHEHSNTQVTPYRFTGKELDEVTGLYYYGARYYDPRTSVWQSPDPILGQYIDGQPNGGIYAPKNLFLYGYAYNNPVTLSDPDGKVVETMWDVANVGLGVASLADNISEGNWGWAALDALGLAYDGFAAAVPILPAGASTIINASRLTKATANTFLEMSSKGNAWINPLTGAVEKVADYGGELGKMQVDHIVPKARIKKLVEQYGLGANNGSDLIKSLEKMEDNLQLLPQKLNGSKGSRNGLDWTEYKRQGLKIDGDYQKALHDAQDTIEAGMIEFIRENKK